MTSVRARAAGSDTKEDEVLAAAVPRWVSPRRGEPPTSYQPTHRTTPLSSYRTVSLSSSRSRSSTNDSEEELEECRPAAVLRATSTSSASSSSSVAEGSPAWLRWAQRVGLGLNITSDDANPVPDTSAYGQASRQAATASACARRSLFAQQLRGKEEESMLSAPPPQQQACWSIAAVHEPATAWQAVVEQQKKAAKTLQQQHDKQQKNPITT